jgi:hypothetical protein
MRQERKVKPELETHKGDRMTRSDDEHVQLDRRVPRWAAMLIGRLAQDQPEVLTREDLSGYLMEVGADRGVEGAIRDLVKLRWLRASRRNGVWLFVPPGETSVGDPYVDLRAWIARDAAIFALAGEAAAWHLGYLDRRHAGPIPMWIPEGVVPPFGLRRSVSVVRLGWGADMAAKLQPTRSFLRQRQFDVTDWAARLPAFGPEALLVQLAVRPSSFRPWMDLVSHLKQFVSDCNSETVTELLDGKTVSAWQRGAYLLHAGGNTDAAQAVMSACPQRRLVHVTLGKEADGVHVPEFGITDRLVLPLLAEIGKA